MPDQDAPDAILGLLKRVQQRTSSNRFLKELASAIAICLVFPLGFKLVDLLHPFSGRTVSIVFAVWLAATVAYVIFRTRGKSTLAESAAELDRTAALHDEIKTAYWFHENPKAAEKALDPTTSEKASAWIEALLRRASETARRLNVNTLFPRVFPRAMFGALALILAMIVLNFLPLSMNHNWFALQAAPDFALSDKAKALLEKAKELLEKAENLKQTDLTDKAQEILKQLELGKITPEQASLQLQKLQQQLMQGNLDIGSINDGLAEIAKELQGGALKNAATSLSAGQIQKAANQTRELAQNLQQLSAEQREALARSLERAGQNQRSGLENLTQALTDAARNLSPEALSEIADQLAELADAVAGQQAANEAGEGLGDLEAALGEGEGEGQGQGEGEGEGQGQGQGQGEGQGQGVGNGPPDQIGPGAGEAGTGIGTGPSSPRRREEATELEVQLQQEPLVQTYQQKPGNIEQASEQQRSKLDYRNVPSELSPAQRDVLNQDRLSFEDRQLVKAYSQAQHPPQNTQNTPNTPNK